MPKTIENEIASLPFANAAHAWLETRRPHIASRTFEDYEKYIKTLTVFFGEMRVYVCANT
jgi:hypothetical protein